MTGRTPGYIRITVGIAASLGFLLVIYSARASDPQWRIGLAGVCITPERPVVLLGYGDRKGPFTSVSADIFAKAMAIEDPDGHRAVILTTDLVGVQAAVFETVCKRIRQKTGLKRNQLLLNASHTHTGPLISLNPLRRSNIAHSPLSPEDAANTIAYTRQLQDKIVDLVARAVSRLEPARLAWGKGNVDFVMNRRLHTKDGVVMAPNPKGIVDRDVPVLRIDSPAGKLRAVLFGCACHNTTLTGKHNLICGDYAGFAQTFIQNRYPSVLAMFMSGCGADANPHPRGTMDQARIHGTRLGEEVCRVLETELHPIHGPLASCYAQVDLPLQSLSRTEIQEYTTVRSAQSLMARQMLAVLDGGETLPSSYRAPFSVWQFGDDLTLVALPAEPVAEYVTLLHQTLGSEKLWIAGYNNDCFGYLPTAQVVKNGGHEAIGVTLWIWGRQLHRNAGFFTTDVQERVVDAVRQLASKAGRTLPRLTSPQ